MDQKISHTSTSGSGSGSILWLAGILLCLLPLLVHFVPGAMTAGIAVAAGIVLVVVMVNRARASTRQAQDATLAMQEHLQTIEQQTQLFRSILENTDAPIVAVDTNGAVLSASTGAQSLLAAPSELVLNGEIHPLREAAHGKAIRDIGLIGTRHGDMTAALNCTPIRSEQGDILGAVCVFQDIHELVEKVDALESKQAELMSTGGRISEVAQRLASASEELSASADEQARGAEQQSEQATNVSTAMEEMTSTVLEVAGNATGTSEAASQAQSAARDGSDMVDQAVNGINSVSESAQQLSQVLEQLETQAGEIGRIINVINDIADQTNLLALNAAIEAARAGEAGRGFAVVADEVRKLAEKTMTATKEVEVAIKTIQASSQEAMTSMKTTEAQVSDSTELSNRAGETLHQIMGDIEDMVMRVTQIATAAEQQSSAAEEINTSIEEIAVIARESMEGAEQAATATHGLAQLSMDLLELSEAFTMHHQDDTKFWESNGSMRGVLPKFMQDHVKAEYSREVYDYMMSEMGDPVFLPTANYPDQVLKQMASLVAEKNGGTTRDVFRHFGAFTVQQFHRVYKRYFRADNLKDMLLTMDDVHVQLTKDYPGIKPPRFTYDDKGRTMAMTYKSGRGLFEYFEGILYGAADFFGDSIDVRMEPLSSETARATITFRD